MFVLFKCGLLSQMNIFFGGLQQSSTVMLVKHFTMNNGNLNMRWSTVYFLTFLLVREILSQRPRENNFFIKVLCLTYC